MNESETVDELVEYVVWGDGNTIYDVSDYIDIDIEE